MTDKTFAAVPDTFAAWQDSRSPDLAQAEARIDCLLQTLFEQSRELADLAGHDVFLRATLGHSLVTIERQQREIARLEAEIARMRTDPARTPLERAVSRLQPWYAFEDTDRPS